MMRRGVSGLLASGLLLLAGWLYAGSAAAESIVRVLGPAAARPLFARFGPQIDYIAHARPEQLAAEGFAADILVSASPEWMMKLSGTKTLDAESLRIIDRQPMILVARSRPEGPAMPGIRRWWADAAGSLPIITPYPSPELWDFLHSIRLEHPVHHPESAEQSWGMLRQNQARLAILLDSDLPTPAPPEWGLRMPLPVGLVPPVPISAARLNQAKEPERAGIILETFAEGK